MDPEPILTSNTNIESVIEVCIIIILKKIYKNKLRILNYNRVFELYKVLYRLKSNIIKNNLSI